MANRPVHWREGMFLGPHHFQLADRQNQLALKESEDWFHPFDWGVASVTFDDVAVANSDVVLLKCRVRFKDGTRVMIPDDVEVDGLPVAPPRNEPDEEKQHDFRLKLSDAQGDSLTKTGSLLVYLAVPKLQHNRPNVEAQRTPGGPRYTVAEIEAPDETTAGREQTVEVLSVSCKLAFSGDNTGGYELLPLARIVRDRKEGAKPRFDDKFVPPLLALDASGPLWQKVQSLYSSIGSTIEELAEQAVDRSVLFESKLPGDSERLLLLWVLNGAYCALQSFVFVRGLTPLFVYRELCRVVGHLSIFGENRRPPEIPQYDHNNLGPCFDDVIAAIYALIRPLGPRSYERRYFRRDGDWLVVDLEPAWLTPVKRLFLGVETDMEHDACVKLLLSTKEVKSLLDIKMGSAEQIQQIFKQALRGLKLEPITIPPRDLLQVKGVVFFEVEQNVFWRNVSETGTLAVMLSPKHAPLTDDGSVTVTLPGSRNKTLKFALFVIDRK